MPPAGEDDRNPRAIPNFLYHYVYVDDVVEAQIAVLTARRVFVQRHTMLVPARPLTMPQDRGDRARTAIPRRQSNAGLPEPTMFPDVQNSVRRFADSGRSGLAAPVRPRLGAQVPIKGRCDPFDALPAQNARLSTGADSPPPFSRFRRATRSN